MLAYGAPLHQTTQQTSNEVDTATGPRSRHLAAQSNDMDNWSDFGDDICTTEDMEAEVAGLMAIEGPDSDLDEEVEAEAERLSVQSLMQKSAGDLALGFLQEMMDEVIYDAHNTRYGSKTEAELNDDELLKYTDVISDDVGGFFRITAYDKETEDANCRLKLDRKRSLVIDQDNNKYAIVKEPPVVYDPDNFGFPKRNPDGSLVYAKLPKNQIRVKLVQRSAKRHRAEKRALFEAECRRMMALELYDEDDEEDEDW